MVDLPLGGDGHIPGRHGGGNGLIPAGKGVACFGRVGRGGNGRTVVLLNDDILPAVFRLKGDGVLVDLPLCRQGQGFGHGIGKVPFAFAVVPADEGIALFSGVGRSGGRGVGTNLGCYFASTLRLEGDRIGPDDLSGDLGAGGLRKPATRRDKHAVGRLAFLLPGRAAGNGPGGHLEPAAIVHINTAALTGRAAGNGPGGHLEPAAIVHINTAALTGRAAHDIAAPHKERAAFPHIDTAAAGISCFSCAGAAGDGAALYHLCAGSVLLPQTGGFRHTELIDRIGLAVHQREGGTVFHPDNAAAAF